MTASPAPHHERQLESLLEGFDALKEEYIRLLGRCQVLENNVEMVKSQYYSLTNQCPHKPEPLVLADAPADTGSLGVDTCIDLRNVGDLTQREKIVTAFRVREQLRTAGRSTPNGMANYSSTSVDRPSAPGSSMMPSISESPLEQDFTVEGTPSKLDCPFASMKNRRLSAHAASVVSRYRSGAATPRSSVSRINGRASPVARASFTDPIKADVCAMEPQSKANDVEDSAQGSTGVCPIRFLDQHSPEEIAAYFETHKHELPRSHEICVKRYQSNEESIKQLDAKYGNLVSMIQGLGQKHVPLLPGKFAEDETYSDDEASANKIRKWASSVDSSPGATFDSPTGDAEGEEGDRQSRFDRPLRDVRLGESPSRPWGIQVPIEAHSQHSGGSSIAAAAPLPVETTKAEPPPQPAMATQAEKPRGRCPFGFDAAAAAAAAAPVKPAAEPEPEMVKPDVQTPAAKVESKPVVIVAPTDIPGDQVVGDAKAGPQMLFTGPVFIGYSMEQAMSILKSMPQQNAQ